MTMARQIGGGGGGVIGQNEDLLSEILLRLPAKPILRFRTVCKNWLSLISEPHFSQRLSHHKKVILRSGDGKSFLVDQMIKEEEQPPMTDDVVEHGSEIKLPLITSGTLEKVIVHSYRAKENSDPNRVWDWNVEFAGVPLGIIRPLLPAARYLDIWSLCYLAYGPEQTLGLNMYFPNCSNGEKKRKIRCLRNLSILNTVEFLWRKVLDARRKFERGLID